MKIYTAIVVILLLQVSCKKDPPTVIIPTAIQPQESVLVLNEGNFQWGNSSTTLINFVTGEISENVFESVNSRPLGDVLNSAFVSDELFLVVNNSQKIERMKDAVSEANSPITGFQSPRYIYKNEDGYFVTDLYANKIYQLNTNYEIVAEIPMLGWGEQMVSAGPHELLVCNATNNMIMKLNTETLQFVDSVSVGDAPRSLAKDALGRVWVLCEGEVFPNETAGSIWCLDHNNLDVVFSEVFQSTQHPRRLSIKPVTQDTLYFLMNGVYRMALNNLNVPESPWLNENQSIFYSLGVENSGNVWVSNAKDYVQNGEVIRYNSSAQELGRYEVGIIPSGFVFY